MIWFVGGIAAFGCFVLYDLNSVLWKKRALHSCFLTGCILLLGMTLYMLISGSATVDHGVRFWVFFLAAVVFVVLLIYTLFFALPFGETYLAKEGDAQGKLYAHRHAEKERKPEVYNRGMYALCRHPGVLWFFLFYFFMGIALYPAAFLYPGLFYSALNVGYVVLQDVWTFPETLNGYGQYKRETPFLLPDKESIRSCLSDIRERMAIRRKQ
ncbi:MAG: hypothetical protein HUJ72_07845 [Blautia sp.]|nr:hypothetical protein [Blautia sp.]